MFRRKKRPSTEGHEAREKAEADLRRMRSETPYYEALGADLRRLRERNHFAENIRTTLRGNG